MRLLARCAAGLALLLLLTATLGAAEPAASPLRYIPAETDMVIEASNPKNLVEALYYLDTVKKLQEFTSVKELLDSTSYRRFYKLVAYFEKELGAKWPELLDQLSGGGGRWRHRGSSSAPIRRRPCSSSRRRTKRKRRSSRSSWWN